MDRIAIAKFLIAQGAKINLKDTNGNTPLHDAAWKERTTFSITLGEKKTTYFRHASYSDFTNVVSLLILKGAEINANNKHGKTALHLAASANHPAIAKLLIDKGAKINVKDKDGHTPFYLAVKKGHKKVIKLLKEVGTK